MATFKRAEPPQNLGSITSTDRRPKWTTQVIETGIDNQIHPPREHPSEQVARAYAADTFRRRKCDVILQDPLGKVVEHLKFDPQAELSEHASAQAARFSEIGTPYINLGAPVPAGAED